MVYVIKLTTNSDPKPYPLHKLSIHTDTDTDNLLTDSLQVYDYYDFL